MTPSEIRKMSAPTNTKGIGAPHGAPIKYTVLCTTYEAAEHSLERILQRRPLSTVTNTARLGRKRRFGSVGRNVTTTRV